MIYYFLAVCMIMAAVVAIVTLFTLFRHFMGFVVLFVVCLMAIIGTGLWIMIGVKSYGERHQKTCVPYENTNGSKGVFCK